GKYKSSKYPFAGGQGSKGKSLSINHKIPKANIFKALSTHFGLFLRSVGDEQVRDKGHHPTPSSYSAILRLSATNKTPRFRYNEENVRLGDTLTGR
ncbi:unnamed protein product, partial [Nesidiocoris tenuis]